MTAKGPPRRRRTTDSDRTARARIRDAAIELPGMEPGDYRVTALDTDNGHILADMTCHLPSPVGLQLPPFRHDLAIAIRRVDPASAGIGPPTLLESESVTHPHRGKSQ